MRIENLFKLNIGSFLNPEPEIGTDEKLNGIFFQLSVIAAFVCTYVLSVQDVLWILRIKQVLLVLIPFLLGLRILTLRKLNIWFIVISLIAVGYYFLTRRSGVIAEFILLSWCYFTCLFGPHRSINRRHVFVIGLILSSIVGLHFIFFEKYDRESIGGLDPNYTSFLIYLLFPFALRSRSVILHLSLTCLGMMTHSRAFILAIGFYYLGLLISKFFSKIKIEFRYYFRALVAFFIILLCYSYYGYTIGPKAYGIDRYGFERLIHIFNNPSDYPRWKANIVYFEQSFKDIGFFLYGLEPLVYLKNIYEYLPHNVVLLELATHGIFLGICFLVLFKGFIKRVYHPDYFPFFAGIVIFWSFLGIEIGAVYTAFMIHTLILLRNTKDQ